MNEYQGTQQESERQSVVVLKVQCGDTEGTVPGATRSTKINPCFVGLIMAYLVPGAAHALSGHWKAGIAWYFSFFVVFGLCNFILSIPSPLSFVTVIAVQLLAIIYFVSLCVSSYRPISLISN